MLGFQASFAYPSIESSIRGGIIPLPNEPSSTLPAIAYAIERRGLAAPLIEYRPGNRRRNGNQRRIDHHQICRPYWRRRRSGRSGSQRGRERNIRRQFAVQQLRRQGGPRRRRNRACQLPFDLQRAARQSRGRRRGLRGELECAAAIELRVDRPRRGHNRSDGAQRR